MATKFLSFTICLIFSIFNAQNKGAGKLDSVVIENYQSPAVGMKFYIIKIVPTNRFLDIKYQLFKREDADGLRNDAGFNALIEKYEKSNAAEIPSSYFQELNHYRIKHTIFDVKNLHLKNKDVRNFLTELKKVSAMTQKDIDSAKLQHAAYVDGDSTEFYFYKNSMNNRLSGYALDSANYKSLYQLLTDCLDLYRKINGGDKSFEEGTFSN